MPVEHKTYSSLVSADDDLVGHVAYALYKRDKLKFCEEFAARNAGRAADDAELAIFIHTSNLATRLQGYRTEAERLLETMAEYQLEGAIAQIQAESNTELLRRLSEAKSWWRSIVEALLGSLVVAIVWGALAMAFYANKFGPERVARDFLDSSSTQPLAPASAARP